ncbi:MAG: hypothetical protein BJ554DRAFT_7174 [Olpidium bornovanus]|uniref:Uncharacterized protein n=1 Tax=Olpidium bornovanus TaxID=278681 RepID=A0A8H7ZWA3_9FUNG|nr:MAG: hypothetical protein BJ554DRAFT_7174 [Olpidium bornovanus]
MVDSSSASSSTTRKRKWDLDDSGNAAAHRPPPPPGASPTSPFSRGDVDDKPTDAAAAGAAKINAMLAAKGVPLKAAEPAITLPPLPPRRDVCRAFALRLGLFCGQVVNKTA